MILETDGDGITYCLMLHMSQLIGTMPAFMPAANSEDIVYLVLVYPE